MESGKKRRHYDPPCEELHPDDGIDPRTYFDNRSDTPDEHRTSRLCAEVARCLELVLSLECNRPSLEALEVVDVTPDPDVSRLRVVVATAPGSAACSAGDLLADLQALKGHVRAEVARSVNRRKTPELIFEVSGQEDDS